MSHQEKERELEINEKMYRVYMDKSPLGIFVTNEEAQYIRVNPAGCRMTGYTEEELKKLTIDDLRPPETKDMTLRLNATEDGMFTGEYIGLRKNGERYWGRIHAARINEKENIAFCEDITEQKKAEDKIVKFSEMLKVKNEELDEAVQKAEAANQTKSKFLANMSHEIRTPLNGILGFLQLLEETDMDQKQQEYLTYIKTSSETLLTIINDILDISKIESGQLELEHIDFNLSRTLEAALVPMFQSARAKGIDLKLEVDSEVPAWVKGDPIRLRQIITNLASNGVKFTEEGSVTVSVHQVEAKDETTTVEILVTDTGIGMSQETIKKIFQPFSQADSSSTRKYGGTGLGLSISRDLIHLMNGEIQAESQLGKGSCFKVRIPFEKGDGEKITYISEEILGAEKEWKDSKVLVVEDQEINLVLVEQVLKNIGISFDVARNGIEAVNAFYRKQHDLILMDIQMPVMDGLEATKRIRSLKNVQQPYIIAMTAHVMQENINQAYDAGMDGYIQKPIDLKQMKALFRKESTAQRSTKAQKKGILFHTDTDKDAEIKAMVTAMVTEAGLDKDLSLELLQQGTAMWIDQVCQAEKDLASGDMTSLKLLFHNMKGTAANLRVKKLSEMATEAEAKVMAEDMNGLRKNLAEIKTYVNKMKNFSAEE
ncbi:hypothetical protein SAMN05192551_10319 [Tindallia magadiensis]|uniref:Stage 0 sporulation protein A homolog n=1 Tax=Tindallia magadiensis TaxID=69895 RepID=A0A1I3CTV5_9FIRM|nr:ATP-binding protein [Tindallia magadiensis]SFH77962.1 hypothetical protein SAMN05192551_10319 [Tindallia magadiensis]